MSTETFETLEDYLAESLKDPEFRAAWEALETTHLLEALRRAKYEILEDGSFYGEILGFQGVYANDDNLEDCRQQLQEVLEDWLVLGLRLGHHLPV